MSTNILALRPTRAIVYKERLRHNYRCLREFLHPKVQICAVVKANAYGHGIVQIAKTLEEEGSDALAVACLSEAWTLRCAGIKIPIHLLGLCLPEEIPAAIDADVIPFICTREETDLWQRSAQQADKIIQVHLAVDTGMGRIGCPVEQAVQLAGRIEKAPNLELTGLSTHFARADEDNAQPTELQLGLFSHITNVLGRKVQCIHAANSAGILQFPASHYTMVRPGLMLYGYSPMENADQDLPFDLKPVLHLVSRVLFLKKVPAGTPISYGAHYVTDKETWIATIPLGYADGYARVLSNRAHVVIRGQRYPVVGSICMDQMMVDVGRDTPVHLYDEVTVFGDDAGLVSAHDVAEQMGSISYEVLTSLGLRIPRIYQD